MKTKKIFTKRLRITKKGKVLARVPGQNHFNAKESQKKRMARRRVVGFPMSHKDKANYLGN
jgi:ribosomal protein L35